jgi:hypothetical protein
MIPRILTFLVVVGLAVFGLTGAALAASDRSGSDGVIARDEDAGGVLVTDDDGDDTDDTDDTDGDDSDSFTSNVDSNDGTNSRVTGVSRDDDLSRGDLTRDRTKDGPGTSTRDRTANHTNDRTRNDTR